MNIETDSVTHLTFDCYGTIIDWESGILAILRGLAARAAAPTDDATLLELHARHEAELEGGPFRAYREVLGAVEERVAADLGVPLEDRERGALAASVPSWSPFEDSVDALRRLAERYRLVVISNIDDDLFEGTRARLAGVDFDDVVTAQQVGAYKPSHEPFRVAFERLGVGPEQVVHVAQSVYHDHVPARELGMRSIRVNRPSVLGGRGITPEVAFLPPIDVPDLAAVTSILL